MAKIFFKHIKKGEIMEYISKEDMIIDKLHLNPKGVLNLVKSMKED